MKSTVAVILAALAFFAIGFLLDTMYPVGPSAQEVRLVGWCNGKLLAAMEEDHFPRSGCDWIEPVNFIEDANLGTSSIEG